MVYVRGVYLYYSNDTVALDRLLEPVGERALRGQVAEAVGDGSGTIAL